MSQLPCKTRATYSWSGDKNSQQLGFMEGDVIEILKVVNEETYFGESLRTKVKGFFPAKYVECELVLDEQSTPSTPISGTSSKNTSCNSLYTLKKQDSFLTQNSQSTDLLPQVNKNRDSIHSSSQVSKKFSSSYVQQLLDSSTLSTDTNSSSAFGHSDFSATSAGSYMRHKEDYDNKLQSMMSQSHSYNDLARKALNDIIETHEKKKPNLFRNLLGYKVDDEPSFDNRLYISSVEKMSQKAYAPDFAQYEHYNASSNSLKCDISSKHSSSSSSLSSYTIPTNNLERSKTVSSSCRKYRKFRTSIEQPDLILRPHKAITDVNREAVDLSTKVKRYGIDSFDCSKVDRYMSKVVHDPYESLGRFTEKYILRKFKSQLEIARAIYYYLTRNFELIEKCDEKISTRRAIETEKIHAILHSRKCTSHQLNWLFHLMADTANLETEIILGYLKHPFTLNETITDTKKRLVINHSWLSIKIEGYYRFIDVTLGNPTNEFVKNYSNIWDVSSINEFYFLARPFHILTTHNSRYIDHQYITPPIDVVAQLSLPPLYPHAIISGVSLHKYTSSIFYLKDSELYDFEIEIPSDYVIQAKFKPFDDSYELVDSFVQVYQKNGFRIAHFQGIMSKNCPSGFVYVTGRNEFSKKWNLLVSIPCFHVGKWLPIYWVNTVSGLNGVDVYIKEPKLHHLALGEQKFNIKLFAKSDYIEEIKELYQGVMKIGLFPPSKQIIELDVYDNESINIINLNKVGEWRLGILDLKNKRWKVIAEWYVS